MFIIIIKLKTSCIIIIVVKHAQVCAFQMIIYKLSSVVLYSHAGKVAYFQCLSICFV